MNIKRVIYVEDTIEKYMSVHRFLDKQGVTEIEWANNAEEVINKIKEAEDNNAQYDLLLSDMHFNYYGKDDTHAGEKVMNNLREMNINIPVVFCSSQNWKIPGSLGNIFYNPRRDWEDEAEELFRELKSL